MNLSPKEFELLLTEFSKQDLPPNFTVEHDIRDLGEESKNYRQIDTKITGKIGISNILICGEAKNWTNPVGNEVIDGIVGKYLSGEIRANKVILFSNQGYTGPAIARAKQLGIDLLEPLNLGYPIQTRPYIIALGSIDLIKAKLTHNSPQQSFMSLNYDQYTILKGDERISFYQNIFRLVRDKLKTLKEIEFNHDISNFKLRDANVLYELSYKPNHKFNADIDIDVDMKWDYHCLDLPSGVLKHLNTDELKFIHLGGDAHQTLNKVLLSKEKKVFENKADCIKEMFKENKEHIFKVCLLDPDRMRIDPHSPLISLI